MAAQNQILVQKIQKQLIKYSLPLFLLLAIIVGLIWPVPGNLVHSLKIGDYHVVQTSNICVIFCISGLTLRSQEVKEALSMNFLVIYLYSLLVILFITPWFGLVVLNVPHLPLTFSIGLVVWCAAPTTITSGATMVNAANGNYVLALMVTVSANTIAIFTVPYILKFFLEKFVQNIHINAVQLLIKLLLTVLLPLILAFILQNINTKIRNFGQDYRVILGVISNANLGIDIWQVISGSQKRIISNSITSILLLVVCGIVIHLIFLSFNYLITRIFKWGEKEKRAVVLLGSQKSLLISVTVISYFGENVGNQGLLMLPCILAYIVQIFVDTLIISRWNAFDDAQKSYNLVNQTMNEDKEQQSLLAFDQSELDSSQQKL